MDFLLVPIGMSKLDYDTQQYIQLEYHMILDKDQYIFVLHKLNWTGNQSCINIEDDIVDSIVVLLKSRDHTLLFDHHTRYMKHMDHMVKVHKVKSYF